MFIFYLGKHFCSFYDFLPEFENEIKTYVAEQVMMTVCAFDTNVLAKHVDKRFYEITETSKTTETLIRSERMLCYDLNKWGVTYDPHTKKIYFEGHERTENIEDRNNFIEYFLQRKDNYYTFSENEQPDIVLPTEKPCVIFFHDESTFRSGEQFSNKWQIKDHVAFYNKGKGRSLMKSDFLVADGISPFFSLNDLEWNDAIIKYPSLLNQNGVDYIEQTCSGSIVPGQDGYFDNKNILDQFERLFQMIEFKKVYHNPIKHTFEVVVDHARTHTTKLVNINEFRLKPNGACPVDDLIWKDEHNIEKKLSCYFQDGPLIGQSKGLKQIALDLGFDLTDIKLLDEIKELLKDHPAFYDVSKLELLGEKYNVKVIFCPKYHCELNPIEGLWCFQKGYVRKRTNQKFENMKELIKESRNDFEEKKVSNKLIRRFWRVLYAYKNKMTYIDVMKTYFSGKSKEKIEAHRKISNCLINL